MYESFTREQITLTYYIYILVGLTNIFATCHLSTTMKGKYAICLYFYSQAFKKDFFVVVYKNAICLEKAQQSLKYKSKI